MQTLIRPYVVDAAEAQATTEAPPLARPVTAQDVISALGPGQFGTIIAIASAMAALLELCTTPSGLPAWPLGPLVVVFVWFQLAHAYLLATKVHLWVYELGLVQLGILGCWMMSRTIGLPILSNAGPRGMSTLGSLVVVLLAVTVLGCAWRWYELVDDDLEGDEDNGMDALRWTTRHALIAVVLIAALGSFAIGSVIARPNDAPSGVSIPKGSTTVEPSGPTDLNMTGDMTGADMSGMDMSGSDMSGSDMSGMDMTGTSTPPTSAPVSSAPAADGTGASSSSPEIADAVALPGS